MMHFAFALWANIAAIPNGQKFGGNADIAAAKVMQQTVLSDMRPPAAGTDLAHVEMMATTFGTETDPVEKTRFEIVAPRENA
jgi:hypothetical protein